MPVSRDLKSWDCARVSTGCISRCASPAWPCSRNHLTMPLTAACVRSASMISCRSLRAPHRQPQGGIQPMRGKRPHRWPRPIADDQARHPHVPVLRLPACAAQTTGSRTAAPCEPRCALKLGAFGHRRPITPTQSALHVRKASASLVRAHPLCGHRTRHPKSWGIGMTGARRYSAVAFGRS